MFPQTEYGELAEWLPLREEDFHFVGYRRPKRFFAGIQRPLRVISTPPALGIVEDALYTPTTRAWKPFDGTIYDCDLRQVPGVVIHRGLEDCRFHADPVQYTGSVEDLPVYEPTSTTDISCSSR